MIKKVEIYFRDLTPKAQNRLLKEFETTAAGRKLLRCL